MDPLVCLHSALLAPHKLHYINSLILVTFGNGLLTWTQLFINQDSQPVCAGNKKQYKKETVVNDDFTQLGKNVIWSTWCNIKHLSYRCVLNSFWTIMHVYCKEKWSYSDSQLTKSVEEMHCVFQPLKIFCIFNNASRDIKINNYFDPLSLQFGLASNAL